MNTLQNKRVAILATEGFEYVELVEPRKALGQAGAKTEVVSPKDGKIKGWATNKMGLPGGVMNSDKLRIEPRRSSL